MGYEKEEFQLYKITGFGGSTGWESKDFVDDHLWMRKDTIQESEDDRPGSGYSQGEFAFTLEKGLNGDCEYTNGVKLENPDPLIAAKLGVTSLNISSKVLLLI